MRLFRKSLSVALFSMIVSQAIFADYRNPSGNSNDNSYIAQQGPGWTEPDVYGSYGGYESPEARRQGLENFKRKVRQGKGAYGLNEEEQQFYLQERQNNPNYLQGLNRNR